VQHLVGRALVAGLCVAALAAIVALLAGEFDDTHGRVIGTALGFSVFAAFAGAGDALRTRAQGAREIVGAATLAVSVLAFALLLIPVWIDDDGDTAWQVWGIAAVLALGGSHASLVLRGARDGDTTGIRALVATSLGGAAIVTAIAVVAIAGAFDDVDEGWGRLSAALLVIVVLATALPPLLRRLAGSASPAPAAERPFADEIAAVADRLDELDQGPEVEREAARLRELAARVRK
jgi:hypothetical protein